MIENHTYQIATLPKLRDEPENEVKLHEIAEKFRELRLKSLRTATDAFVTSYESEKAKGLDQTLERLANPKAVQFIALRKSDLEQDRSINTNDLDRILRREWVGMIVLLGPEEGNELSVPSANLDPYPRMTAASTAEARLFEASTTPGTLHFHLNGTFVDTSTRGGGLGTALVDAALRRAEAEAVITNASLRVTLSVFAHNVAARKTYEKAGFKVLKEVQSRSRPEFVAVHMERSLAADP